MSTRASVADERRPLDDLPTLPSDDPGACEVFQADPGRLERVRATLVDWREVSSLAETFRALGDPTRVRVLDALSHGELCVCDLAELAGLSQSAISHQLRVLRTLRLVRARREGRLVFYALDDDHVVHLFREGLRHVAESSGEGAPGSGARGAVPRENGQEDR